MRTIINGRKYDTETAKLICQNQYSNNNNDGYYVEKLYRKKTEEFFLYGCGGPTSKYSKQSGNFSNSGSMIIPFSETEAAEFVEKHASVEIYEELFGEVSE